MKKEITIDNHQILSDILGSEDRFLKTISKSFDVKVRAKGNTIFFEDGKEVEKVEGLLNLIIDTVKKGYRVNSYDLAYAIRQINKGLKVDFTEIFSKNIKVALKGKIVYPRTYKQLEYINAILGHDIVCSIGPAGTGKTYLAMAVAINYLLEEKVKKIILTRPVVEAGESLGYLPGNLEEKINPYLRPLYDAIFDMMSYEKFTRLSSTGQIEIAPLAYMRGRTLNDAFIILDEAQNTNTEQMKMFLTRIGINSKAVLTGDITQVDLPNSKSSGLVHIQEVLKKIQDIRFIYFSSDDVVRHYLVQRIVEAYEEYYKKNQ
ncbi:MAG: PhoH family protein [Spirochaetes bacterium]|nr:PhoH family protein [Spirochaetota bacterium]